LIIYSQIEDEIRNMLLFTVLFDYSFSMGCAQDAGKWEFIVLCPSSATSRRVVKRFSWDADKLRTL